MVNSKFNQQTGILESEFTEDVTLTEIVDYIVSTKENIIYPRLLKIKTNATNANFKFSIDDLETIVIENDKSLEKYDFIIDAIIVDNPKTTVISMLYQELEKNDKYRFNVFSTDEGASNWLENY
jgi:phosphoketolase